VLVTGDDVAVAEVKEVATAALGVVVKRSINVRAVELAPLAMARQEIEAGARNALPAQER
jgi:D-aminopeptidase